MWTVVAWVAVVGGVAYVAAVAATMLFTVVMARADARGDRPGFAGRLRAWWGGRRVQGR